MYYASKKSLKNLNNQAITFKINKIHFIFVQNFTIMQLGYVRFVFRFKELLKILRGPFRPLFVFPKHPLRIQNQLNKIKF
jgi:hypothetical protein